MPKICRVSVKMKKAWASVSSILVVSSLGIYASIHIQYAAYYSELHSLLPAELSNQVGSTVPV